MKAKWLTVKKSR